MSIKWKIEVIMPSYIVKRQKIMQLGLVGPIGTLIAFRLFERVYSGNSCILCLDIVLNIDE